VYLTVPIINFAFETIIFDYKNNYNSNNSKIENQDNNKNNIELFNSLLGK
jgi:hypothetical protein